MGFPRFAALISFDEDKSTTIYRRFDRVAARDLLRMEGELAWLEAEQDLLDKNMPKELEPELSAALISTQEHKFHANYQWDQDFDAFCTRAQRKWREISTIDTSSPGETWKESLETVYGLFPSQEDYAAAPFELRRDLEKEMKAAVLDASSRALRSSLYSPKWIERLKSLVKDREIHFSPRRPDETINTMKGWDFIESYSYDRCPHFQDVFKDLRAIYQEVCHNEFLEIDQVGNPLAYACTIIALKESARRVRVKYAAKERLDVSHTISSKMDRYCMKIRLRRDQALRNLASVYRRSPQIAKRCSSSSQTPASSIEGNAKAVQNTGRNTYGCRLHARSSRGWQ